MKNVQGKTPYELIPVEAMEQFALAMKYGADKHEVDDWRQGNGMPWTWLIAAALRHSFAMLKGENYDRDSGLHHGAHLMCCGAMLVYYCLHYGKYNKDDRFKHRSTPTLTPSNTCELCTTPEMCQLKAWCPEFGVSSLKCCDKPHTMVMTSGRDGTYIWCSKCNAKSDVKDSVEDAWRSWNSIINHRIMES